MHIRQILRIGYLCGGQKLQGWLCRLLAVKDCIKIWVYTSNVAKVYYKCGRVCRCKNLIYFYERMLMMYQTSCQRALPLVWLDVRALWVAGMSTEGPPNSQTGFQSGLPLRHIEQSTGFCLWWWVSLLDRDSLGSGPLRTKGWPAVNHFIGSP